MPSDERQRPRRARELGIVPGELAPAELNAITDVPGVRVGHTTVVEGADIRTGVTAVVPTALPHDALVNRLVEAGVVARRDR